MARNKKRADGRVQKRIYIGTVDGKKQYKSVYGRTDAEAERAARVMWIEMNGKEAFI